MAGDDGSAIPQQADEDVASLSPTRQDMATPRNKAALEMTFRDMELSFQRLDGLVA
jgi:hypothetical protein